MSRIVTDWVLELGGSQAGLEKLISTVDLYNTTIAKAAQSGKAGFTQIAQQQQQVNQQLVSSVTNQTAINKALEGGTAIISKSIEAEKQLGTASTEASDKAKKGLEQNIADQQALTKAIDATAAAAERVAAGGSQLQTAVPASVAPVAPTTAIIGAVPSPSVVAVTEEFNRQIAAAKEAGLAAQNYAKQVNEAVSQAKAFAIEAGNEAKADKAVYDEDLASLRKLEQAEAALASAREKAAPGEQWLKANAALERNLALQSELTAAVQASKEAYQQSNQAAIDANANLVEANALQSQAKQLVKETADAEKGLQIAAKAAIAAANEEARATGLIGRAEEQLTALVKKRKEAQTKPEIKAIGEEIAALNKEIDAYKKLGQAETKPSGGGFFSSFIGQLSVATAGFFTFQKAYQLFTDGLENAAKLNGIKSAFNALTGSAEGGAAEFEFLDQKSKELGLDLISTADSYKLLFASAKEAGLPLEETRKIFSAITAEGKVLGLSNAKLEASLRAVSQMLGKGVVSSEELRRQLGEALPDATAQAAKALGVTTAKLDEMLRKGQIISSDFLPKFAAQIQKTYGGATGEAAVQLQANLNRISNSYAKFTAGIVGFFAPAIASLAELTNGFASQRDIAKDAMEAFERQSAAVTDLNDTIPALLKEYETLTKKTTLTADEQVRLRKVIDLVAGAIPGAVTKFDQYGIALGLNSKAVEAFLGNNAVLAKRLKEDATRQQKELLDQLVQAQADVVKKLNDVKMIDGVARLKTAPTFAIGADPTPVPFDTQRESDKEEQRLLALNSKLLTEINTVREGSVKTSTKLNESDAKTVKQLSIILELQGQIKFLTDARAAVTKGDFSADNTTGGGEKQIKAYTEAIDKLQKELDALLGKNQKKTADTSAAALKALLAEEKRLRQSYNQAVLNELKDAGQARAAEQLKQDFNEIAAAEKTIKTLELAYAKAGGRGVNADGKINNDQQDQINALRLLAVQKYNEEIDRINREAIQKSLDLRVDSDEKELAQLRAKFVEEIRATQVANDALGSRIETASAAGNQALVLSLAASKVYSDQLLADLKAAAVEQEKLLLRQQALNAIDTRKQLQTDSVEAGNLPIRQPATVTADDSGILQAGASQRISFVRSLYEKLFTLETDLEKQKQKALLQIQIDANNDSLKQYENDFSEKGIVIKAGLIDANTALSNQLNEIQEPAGRKFDLMKLLGVAPEDQDNVKAAMQEAGTQLVNQIGAFAQAQVDAANMAAEASKQNLEDKRSDLDTELALNKQGFASNVGLRQQELSDAKAARDQSLADQKKALAAQQALETVQQTISLITASSSILKGFSAIPIIGVPLGIAAVAAMFGFFIAAKAKAAGSTKLEKGGLHGGKSHAEGGNKYMATDGSFLEIEEGEFTIRKTSTRKHRELIEAINADDVERIHLLSLRGLLKGTGVRLSSEVPKRIQRNQGLLMEKSIGVPFDAEGMKRILLGIKNNTAPKKHSYETDTHRVEVDGNYTRRIRKQ
jgi:tape measure domain-containing protein